MKKRGRQEEGDGEKRVRFREKMGENLACVKFVSAIITLIQSNNFSHIPVFIFM